MGLRSLTLHVLVIKKKKLTKRKGKRGKEAQGRTIAFHARLSTTHREQRRGCVEAPKRIPSQPVKRDTQEKKNRTDWR